jgi:hypothetical protein
MNDPRDGLYRILLTKNGELLSEVAAPRVEVYSAAKEITVIAKFEPTPEESFVVAAILPDVERLEKALSDAEKEEEQHHLRMGNADGYHFPYGVVATSHDQVHWLVLVDDKLHEDCRNLSRREAVKIANEISSKRFDENFTRTHPRR